MPLLFRFVSTITFFKILPLISVVCFHKSINTEEEKKREKREGGEQKKRWKRVWRINILFWVSISIFSTALVYYILFESRVQSPFPASLLSHNFLPIFFKNKIFEQKKTRIFSYKFLPNFTQQKRRKLKTTKFNDGLISHFWKKRWKKEFFSLAFFSLLSRRRRHWCCVIIVEKGREGTGHTRTHCHGDDLQSILETENMTLKIN